jgi:alpha-maltose-1-phosphate synthase
MRVAYICADPGVPVFGTKGASVHVQEIIRAWRNAGAHVTVYCAREGSLRPADLRDLDVVEIRPATAEGAARERVIENAARDLARQVVRDGCGLAYERYSLFSTALSHVVLSLGVPAVLEVNAPLIEEQQLYRQLWNVGAAENALRSNAGIAGVVACVSSPVVEWVTGRVPEARTLLAPNGVNVQRVGPRGPHRPNPHHLTVAFVGTLKPWHGVPILLDAVALANSMAGSDRQQWTARVIGDGPGRAALEARASGLGIRAEFTGAVAPESVPELLGQCDAAAAPYPLPNAAQADYFSPLKVYEYMAAAMPIVASRVGQIPDILDDGRTGLLVPPGETAAFAQALLALGQDPGLRQELGANARAKAVQCFSWDQVLAGISAALQPARKAAGA